MIGEAPRGNWQKLSVLLQPVGGLLTALSVATVGIVGTQTLEHRQSLDTNARLYSELMSRREEAESSLRKDMFVSIIQNFLQPEAATVDSKVLNLELLAYNFHDSLHLEPLFLDLERKLRRREPSQERDELLERVVRVAREMAAKQLFALEGHGQSFRRFVDLEELAAAGAAGLALEGETVEIGEARCDVGLHVVAVDPTLQRLQLRLEATVHEEGRPPSDTRAMFEVSWFDFPMIDNTRLANGLRCAVTLSGLSEVGADLTGICFPGEYASLKDRPYYDEVIQTLQQAAREQRRVD